MRPQHRNPSRRHKPGLWAAPAARAAVALCLLAAAAPSAWGVTHLKRRDVAPEIALRDQDAREFSLKGLRGSIVVVIFGEPYHDRTRQACEQVSAVLRDPRLEDIKVVPILVATHDPGAEDLKPGQKRWMPATVLKDPERKAFEEYRVVALPSIVVIDRDGRVAHAIGGLSAQLGDVVADAVLMSAGKLSPEKFEQSLTGKVDAPANEKAIRAERLAQLARQLARRGMDDLAIEKYTEVLQLAPQHPDAHLGLGNLRLKETPPRLDEAERHFRATLAETPQSQDATLGLVLVQIQRGGAELVEAERTLRGFLVKSPSNPRANYLLGLVQEQQKKTEDAAASFKKAAQSLLETAGSREDSRP